MDTLTGKVMALFSMPGGWEWIVILIIALLIFGSRLPGLARSLGKTLTEFKKGLHEAKDEIDKEVSQISEEEKKEPQNNSENSQNS